MAMNTYVVEFARTIVIDVEIEDGMTIDDIKDLAWQEFGSRELLHSDFDIIDVIQAEAV